jgi:5,10-methylenetetrahydrofolate reductase
LSGYAPARCSCRNTRSSFFSQRRHVNLTTTELYTRVSINLLRHVYAATHPAAHLGRPETSSTVARDAAAEQELSDTLAAGAEQVPEEA